MRKLRTIVTLALMATAAPTVAALATWTSLIDEDPMSDQKIAIAAISTGEVTMLIKCWENEPKETLLMVSVGSRHVDDEFSTISVRADKSEPREIAVKGKEFNGKQGYFGVAEFDDDILAYIKQIAAAKTRLAISVAGLTTVLSVSGAAKAIKTLSTTCKLQEP